MQALNQGFDMVYNKDRSGHVFKSKSELKHECWEGQSKNKLTVTNSNKAWEMSFAPTSLNKDGVTTEFANEGKFTPSPGGTDNKYEANVSAKTGGYELGPVVPYLFVSHYIHFSINI